MADEARSLAGLVGLLLAGGQQTLLSLLPAKVTADQVEGMMIAEIQVLPSPSAGNEANPYAYVEAAIGVIQNSGLKYEVGALGTTMEGPDDTVWETLRSAQKAVIAAGAQRVACEIKVHASAEDQGPRMDNLTSKFR